MPKEPPGTSPSPPSVSNPIVSNAIALQNPYKKAGLALRVPRYLPCTQGLAPIDSLAATCASNPVTTVHPPLADKHALKRKNRPTYHQTRTDKRMRETGENILTLLFSFSSGEILSFPVALLGCFPAREPPASRINPT